MAGGAFLTIQKAINVAASLDFNGFNVTIHVGAGTYAGAVSFSGPFVGTGSNGLLQLTGDTTTPSNVILSGGIGVTNGCIVYLGGFKMTSLVFCSSCGVLNINGQMGYGAVGGQHMLVTYGGSVNISANYTISGNATIHWLVKQAGRITAVGITITFSGTITFSSLFAYASQGGGILEVNGITWVGTFTGQRFNAELCGGIITGGGGINYFPGTVAGTTTSPGWYQ